METKAELDRYVVHWYRHLMTRNELLAERHLSATMKAMSGASDVLAQEKAKHSRVHARLLSQDIDVLRLASEGFEKFVARTAARILADSGDKVAFNRCPKCGGLTRTPTAKQCRFCGHDWHSEG